MEEVAADENPQFDAVAFEELGKQYPGTATFKKLTQTIGLPSVRRNSALIDPQIRLAQYLTS